MNQPMALSVLVPLPDVAYSPRYLLAGRPGATATLLLHPWTAQRLRCARDAVRNHSRRGAVLDVLVWDAWRPASVQSHIFEEYVAELVGGGLTRDAAVLQAQTFVRHPGTVYPHGTGGTVDLTVTVNGVEANMGTAFDEFSPKAHRRWYEAHPPTTDVDAQAHILRTVLEHAMCGAGFAALEDEWWHYEWGTQLWSEVMGQPRLLCSVVADERVLPNASLAGHSSRLLHRSSSAWC